MSEQWRNLKSGDKVRVTNKTRLDHAFKDRIGDVLYYPTSNGFARVHLDGDQETQTVLVHPESLQVLLSWREITREDLRNGGFLRNTLTGEQGPIMKIETREGPWPPETRATYGND